MANANIDIGGLLKEALETAVKKDNIIILLVGSVVVGLGSAFTFGILMGPLTLGLAGACLKMARNEPVEMGDLWTGFSRFFPAFLAALAVGIMIGIGFALLVLPGLIVAFLATFTFHVMADDPDVGAVDAIKRSFGMVKDNIGNVAIVWIILWIANAILGATGVGGIVSAGVTGIILAFTYVKISAPTA